jgi:tryptophan synthase alpha chain
MTAPTRAAALAAAIRHPKRPGRPAVMPYVIGGWPDAATWGEDLLAIADVADAIEVGIPFSDPMADGPVIQRASRQALDAGVTLDGILSMLAALPKSPGCPLVLMSYVNPLLALGLPNVLARAAAAHVHGFIVPDLPWEESAEMREACAQAGLALVQLVTPATPDHRLALLTARDDGFVYAVTVNGITGAAFDPAAVHAYLDRVRAISRAPVCAGFGIRTAADIDALHAHADGAIVGTALIQHLLDGGDARAYVRALAKA